MSSNIQRAGFGHVGIILTVVLFVGVLGTLAWVFFQNFTNQADKSTDKQSNVTTITSFDECKESPGSKILEMFPEQCVTADGKTFTNSYATTNKDLTYCTPAEKLCFDIPMNWTLQHVERDENEEDPSNTDKISLISPNSDLYLHLSTGISGLGGTCDSNDASFTVVSSIPTRLTGFEENEFYIATPHVVQLVERNLNNYVASMFVSERKYLETAGEKTDGCKLMYATVLPGRYSHPYDETESDDHGGFTFFASQSPYESLLTGDNPEFATKAEAEAIFETDTYQQATAILTSLRYKE